MNFGEITTTLRLNISEFTQRLNQASNEAKSFMQKLRDTTGGVASQAEKSKFAFKDVSRIVQGIIISKIFYSGLNAIRSCVDAVKEFSSELEYTRMVYSTLFGDVALAEEFIRVLKDFSSTSPFSFEDASKAAQQLAAYGIQYKNLMYMMKGVMSAATMQGNAEALSSVSRALGQIYTKGTLKAQEMLQLTEAGIPAYEILQEKLGLTAAQLADLGNQGIDAATAINALVDGLTERYGKVLDYASMTMVGIISNIKDNFVMLMQEVMSPAFVAIKRGLGVICDALTKLYQISSKLGTGGVFEELVPDYLQDDVRQLVVAIQELWGVIKNLATSAIPLLNASFGAHVDVLTTLVRVASLVGGTISLMLQHFLGTQQSVVSLTNALATAIKAWLLFKSAMMIVSAVKAAIDGIRSIVSALRVLSAMLLSTPWALFAAGAVLAIGICLMKFTSLGSMVNNTISAFKKLFNTNVGGTLQKSVKGTTADVSKFSEKLDGSSNKNSATKALKNTGKAAKEAAKALLSFDEVFKLPDENTDAGSGKGSSDAGNVDVPSIGDVGGVDVGDMFEDTDIGTPIQDFVTKLKNLLKSKLQEMFGDNWVADIISVGLGAGLGAVVGGILGGPIGAALGSIAGAIIGYLATYLSEALNMTGTEEISTIIGGGIGAAIGAVVGGPAGAVIGGAIGSLAGWVIGAIIDGVTTGNWDFSALGTGIGTAIGAAIGGIIGGPAGAAIGAAIGMMVGDLAGLIIEGIATGDWDVAGMARELGSIIIIAIGLITGGPVGGLVGAAIAAVASWIFTEMQKNLETEGEVFSVPISTAIGGALGASIGLIVGGPGGAAIGGAIGTLAGWIFGKLTDGIKSNTGGYDKVGTELGLGIGGAIGAITGGPPGAVIGGALGSLVGWMVGTWTYLFSNYDISEIGEALKQWFLDSIQYLFNYEWTKDLFSFAGEFFSDAVDAFKEKDWGRLGKDILMGVLTGLSGAVTAIFEPISKIFTSIWDAFCDLFGIHSPAKEMEPIGKNVLLGLLEGITGAITSIPGAIAGVVSSIVGSFKDGLCSLAGKVGGWLKGVPGAIGDALSGAKDKAKEVFNDVKDAIKDKAGAALDTVKETFGNITGSIGDALSGAKDKAKEAFNGVKNAIADKAGAALSTVKDTFGDITSAIKDKLSGAKDKAKDAFEGIKNAIKDKASAALSNVKETFGNITSAIKDKLSGAKDKAKEAFSNVKKAISDKISSTLGNVKETFGNITSAIKDKLSGAKDKAGEAFENVKNAIKDKIGTTLDNVKETFGNITDAVKDKLSTAKDKASEAFENVKNAVKDKIGTTLDNVKETFGNITDAVKDKLSTAKDKAGEAFENVKNAVKDKIGTTLDNVKDTFGNITNAVKDKLAPAKDKAKEAFESVKAQIKEKTGVTLTDVKTVFGSMTDAVKDKLAPAKGNAKDVFENIKSNVKSKSSDALSSVMDKFSSIASTIADKVKAARDNVEDKFNTIKSHMTGKISDSVTSIKNSLSLNTFVGLGNNVLSGILSGMTNCVSSIKQAATTIYNQIVDKVKSVFGIHSPAKNMKPLGGFVTQGFAVGIEGATGYAKKAVETVSDTITDGFSNAGDAVAQGLSGAAEGVQSFSDIARTTMSEVADNINNGIAGISTDSFLKYKISPEDMPKFSSLCVDDPSASVGRKEATPVVSAQTDMSDASVLAMAEAIGQKVAEYLLPTLSTMNSDSNSGVQAQTAPMYVGTLIADDAGLRQLERKLNVIRQSEARRGV